MNKDNAAQYLPLVQALADGKTIEFRTNERRPWMEVSEYEVTFVHKAEYYRIKPEPLVRYMVKGGGDEYTYSNFDSATTCAERLSKLYNHEYIVHKMVEELHFNKP